MSIGSYQKFSETKDPLCPVNVSEDSSDTLHFNSLLKMDSGLSFTEFPQLACSQVSRADYSDDLGDFIFIYLLIY